MAVTANAGADRSVQAFERVALDGSDSVVTLGLVKTYSWSQTAGPIVAMSLDGPRATFTAPGGLGATLTFALIITSNDGTLSAIDTVNVAVARAKLLKRTAGAWVGVREVSRLKPKYAHTRATNPARSIVDTTEGTAVFTDGARTVALTSATLPPRTFSQIDSPLTDAFGRTRSGTGWGQADAGGKWACSGGAGTSDFSVASNAGTISLGTANVSRRAVLGSYDTGFQFAEVTFAPGRSIAPGSSMLAGLMMSYADSSNHYRCRVRLASRTASDAFATAQTAQWGPTATGQQWNVAGGPEADYSVASGTGRHSLTAVNSSRRTYLAAPGDGTDYAAAETADVRVQVSPAQASTGAGITGAVMLRYTDPTNHYLARLRFAEDGKVYAAIQKLVGSSTASNVGAEIDTGLTYSAGSWFNLRATIAGDTLNAKVWADGGSEPGSWTLTRTDASLTGGGYVGMRSYALGSVTNTLPVTIAYRAFSVILDDGEDFVSAQIHRFQDGASQLLASYKFPDLSSISTTALRVRAMRTTDGYLRMKVWDTTGTEPGPWSLSVSDNAFLAGRVGIIASSAPGEPTTPTPKFSAFYAEGEPVAPPRIAHGARVRLLPAPYDGGPIPEAWLTDALADTTPDVLEIAMGFLDSAPEVYNPGGIRIRGRCGYGAANADGSLIEGADFNDYLGVPWNYSGTNDAPEVAEVFHLDCSGLIRAVFGPQGAGMGVSSGTTPDGMRIPRLSRQQVETGAPGTQVIAHTGSTPPTNLSVLQVGDIVGFDATSEEESSGQIDHVGIFLGLDIEGRPRFISSRKTPNGPTFSDTGGPSTLDGIGLYASTFRAARRF